MSDGRLQRFFWICAGTPVEIIEKYPTEHAKYLGIGATIFFTALFAALSGGYALYFVFAGAPFDWFASILFGIFWGLAIFNLDRYIVSSIKKTSKGVTQFYQASPRLVLAVLIAIVIARPLELKIFDKEIREKLRERYLADQQAQIKRLQESFKTKYALELSMISRYRSEYDELDKDTGRLREELKAEVFGDKTSTTSGVVGYGSYAKNKEAVVQAKQARLDYLARELASLEEFVNRQKGVEGINSNLMLSDAMLDQKASEAGFADRNWALGALTHSTDDVSRSSAHAVTFITLLIIAFECAPLIVKLLSDAGPSDVDIRESEARIIARLVNPALPGGSHLARRYNTPSFRSVPGRRNRFSGYRRRR
ncbi:DUF4407 domain-containing protein [Chlorobaculum sp. MV4-Y]|jgi:hypothetical protein|uniref:DUF4407 domain-containing protein n=1 Tax=Chlorobaculum sp. MV4-Y TaxID=2976335 RepID=UPI0021AE56AE|nr:DUF4407 domain-containing protein [Chlorobaculum sp. MV4-Y]UWX58162.1 DUF4407 domain-containing protein [Chlorobaculum sp. MV4-Y]